MCAHAEVLADEVIHAHALIQAALQLHQPQQVPIAPDGYMICPTCDKGFPPATHVRWPCPTYQALTP